MSTVTTTLPRQRYSGPLRDGVMPQWASAAIRAAQARAVPLQHAPGCPPPPPQLDGGTPGEDASVVLVVGACHDCDALGPVVLIPCWETLTHTSGATRPVRGVDAALCHLCAGKRLADQGGVAW